MRSVASDCLINLKVSRNFLRQIGKNGGLARAAKVHAVALAKERISERNRRNALKRWHRQEITSDPPADPGPSEQPRGLTTSTASASMTGGAGFGSGPATRLGVPSRSACSASYLDSPL